MVLSTTPTTVSGLAIASRTWPASGRPGSGARSALWKSADLRLPQKAANPARLLRLAAGLEGAGQQAGPGDRGDRRDGGEGGFAAVFAAAGLQPAAAAGELPGEFDAGGGGHAVEHDDDREPLLGYRARDAVEQVLHEQQVVGRRGCLRPGGEPAGEVGVQSGPAVPRALPQGRVGLGEPRHPAGVGAGDRGEGTVGPGPGAEHPGRGFGQRRGRFLGRGEPAGQPDGVGGRADLRVAVPLAAVRADRDERLLGRGERAALRGRRGSSAARSQWASAAVSASARAVNLASRPASRTRERLARACLPSSVPASSARIASARSQSSAAWAAWPLSAQRVTRDSAASPNARSAARSGAVPPR